jgi:hypothetical protein
MNLLLKEGYLLSHVIIYYITLKLILSLILDFTLILIL